MATDKVDIAETNISARQMSEFFRLAALNGHVNRETFQAYLEKRDPFEDKVPVQTGTKKFVIDIPTDLTIAQMVELGKYNWVNENIKTKFESDQSHVGKWECELVDPKKSISSEQAFKLCSEDEWLSAKVDHLLMFASTYPEEQRKRWIVGLGSSCQMSGGHDVPVLSSFRCSRSLSLNDWRGAWDSSCVFLRVRHLSA